MKATVPPDLVAYSKLFTQLDLIGDHNPVAVLTRFHWDRVLEVSEGKVRPPLVWELNPSGICNLKCHFCLYPDGKSLMPKEQFFNLVDQAKINGAKAIIVAGDGEPLVHPKIEELLYYVRDSGLDLYLFTNGTLIGSRVSIDCIVDCCTMIIWGIYGADSASYKSVTQNDMFEKVTQNVRNVIAKRALKGSSPQTPVIIAGWVGVAENVSDARKMAELGSELGVDWVYLRNDVTGEGFANGSEVQAFAQELKDLKFGTHSDNPNFIQGRVLFDRELPFETDDEDGLIALLHPGTKQWPINQRWLSRYDILYVGPRGDLRVSNRKDTLTNSNEPFVIKNIFENSGRFEAASVDISLKSGEDVVGQTSGRKALINLFYNLVASQDGVGKERIRTEILARYPETKYSEIVKNYF